MDVVLVAQELVDSEDENDDVDMIDATNRAIVFAIASMM